MPYQNMYIVLLAIGVTIGMVMDKISVFLILYCCISAIEDLHVYHKLLESGTRTSVYFVQVDQ